MGVFQVGGVLGGVVAQLRGRGLWARGYADQTLLDPVRDAVARWATDALDQFIGATATDLVDTG